MAIATPGTRLEGRYVIRSIAGHGRVGVVFLAEDARLDQQPVAVFDS